jgi:acetyl esterase
VPTVDSRIEQLLDAQAARPAVPMERLTAPAVREDDLAVLALQSRPGPLYAIETMPLAGTNGLDARVYRPRAQPSPVLVYFHGGGFVIGAAGYDRPLRDLARTTGCLIVAPNVRLAPEHPFPAAVEDALAVMHGIAAAGVRSAGGAGPVGIAGDSSGGNLAAVATRELSREGHAPAFQVLVYPMLDATASSPSYREFATGYGFTRDKSLWYFSQYLRAGIDRSDPRVSPLFEPDLSGLPPTLVITAECDPLRDEGERYADAIRAVGGDATSRRYRGMIHGFFQMTGLVAAAYEAQTDIANWIRSLDGHQAPAPGADPGRS